MDSHIMILVRISQAAVLVPLVIGFLRKKLLNREQKLLLLLASISLLSEISAFILDFHFSLNNLLIYNCYNIIWFIILILIYRKVLRYYFFPHLHIFLIGGFLLFAVGNMMLLQPPSAFNTNSIGLALSIFMILSLLFFHKDLTSNVNLTMKNRPLLWLNTGIFLYSSGTLLLFLFINQIIESGSEIMIWLWGLNAFLNILLNAFYAMALGIKPAAP